jgi:hypothetical protein
MTIADHKRDDGQWCRWSHCTTARRDGQCPDRCASVAPERKPRRSSKARQLVDAGLADSLADARAQLRDMGD